MMYLLLYTDSSYFNVQPSCFSFIDSHLLMCISRSLPVSRRIAVSTACLLSADMAW